MSVLRSALQPMLRDVELKWDVKVDGKAADILTIPSQLPPLFSGVFLTAFSLIEAELASENWKPSCHIALLIEVEEPGAVALLHMHQCVPKVAMNLRD
eukprot:TsM_000125100 transcript=TsM_000125100 gene=TsM_000125100